MDPRMNPEVVKKSRIEAILHLDFCIELYRMQLDRGLHFLHELRWQLQLQRTMGLKAPMKWLMIRVMKMIQVMSKCLDYKWLISGFVQKGLRHPRRAQKTEIADTFGEFACKTHH